MAIDRPATVRQLLTSPSLSAACVVGGEAGLNRPVSDVSLRTVVDKDSRLEPGEVVVFDAAGVGQHLYQVDIALRVCADAEAAALIVTNHGDDVGLGPQRLANRFDLPLLSLSDADTMSLTHRLRAMLWATDVEQASHVNELLDQLTGLRLPTIDEVVDLLSEIMSTPVALVGRNRELIAGSAIEIGERRLATASAYNVDRLHSMALHSSGIVLAPGEEMSYWLLAETGAPDGTQRLVRTLVQIGAWYVTALLASGRVAAESDARRRLAVLNEILDTSEMVERDIQRQLHDLGWSAVGWNTGVHIKLRGADAARIIGLRPEIRSRLRDEGLDGPLVERNDGWSGWFSQPSEPPVESYADTVRRTEAVLRSFVTAHSGLTAHAGIGRPYPELDGLRRSLTEAHEAAVIANARGQERHGAAHIDQLGVQRVLMGWFSSDDFARYARSTLQPILEVDADHELLHTLEVYLDSSCSTTTAAHKLAVHRNTVANRVRRISDVLDVELEDPETRLSLQLACRVLRINH